jgi:predicted dehydrogenase
MTVAEAEDLCRISEERNLELCITYTYAHYPMIRQARRLIQDGAIGELIDIIAEYPEDWQMLAQNKAPDHFSNWFADPAKAGSSSVTSGMGIHVWYLIKAMTNLDLEQVIAQFGYYPKDARLESNARILTRYQGGVPGMIWTSSTAIGHDCTILIKIFGDKGAIEWDHDDPTHLRVALVDQPVQVMTCERAYLYDESRGMSRLPAGHPEGFYEAFANIYRAFCQHLLDKKSGNIRGEYYYPKGIDGLEGMKFVDACVRSHADGNTWQKV